MDASRAHRPGPRAEELESRRLLAATVTNGVLVVTATSGPDVVTIRRVLTDDVVATVNGVSKTFDMDDFNTISLYGGAGNDWITIAAGTGRVAAYGEDGNDTLTLGDADDSLFGGAGVDKLYRSGEATPFVSLSGGVITVMGTVAGDAFFSKGDNEDEITVGINGSEDLFDLDDDGITDIRLLGLGGNDHFRLRDFVRLLGGYRAAPVTTADGGTGDDFMFVDENAKESLIGGDGNDEVQYNYYNYYPPTPFDGGPGIDSVRLENRADAFTYPVPPTVENAILFHGNLVGNALPNRLQITMGGDGGVATIRGGGGNDTLIGGEAGESDDYVLLGEEGNDQLFGGDGDDTLDGGPGSDTLDGQLGNDTLLNGEVVPGPGNIRIANRVLIADGTWGAERITIERIGGDDVIVRVNDLSRQFDMDDFDGVLLRGNNGYDSMSVLQRIVAGSRVRKVTLEGGNGNDTLGGAGDVMRGGAGDDDLSGGSGNHALFGGAGNDRLFGGPGLAFLDGGDNNDYLWALDGSGGDTVLGGNGTDTAQIDPGDNASGVEKFE